MAGNRPHRTRPQTSSGPSFHITLNFKTINRVHPPPRFLLGLSLLFWGVMTGRPLIGLVLALLVEAAHWTRVRWDFDDDSLGVAWQFTSIAIALGAVLIWLDGDRYTALPGLISWLPLLLIPMQFVQSYGMRESMPLSLFSFLAKHRRQRNKRLGLIEETTYFNFGSIYFASALTGATVGSKAENPFFLPGLVVLTGWMLQSRSRPRIAAIVPPLVIAALLALGGQTLIERANDWLGSSSFRRFDPNYCATLIGSRGTVKQSPDIVWRLRPGQGSPPKLLRSATFNIFLTTNWQNQRVAGKDFNDLTSIIVNKEPHYLLHYTEMPEKIPGLAWLPTFSLRGAAETESALPLPGDAAALREFESDTPSRNSFGTVRVFPKQSIIDVTVSWKGGTNPESAPILSEDLRMPVAERPVMEKIADEIGLQREIDLRRKLEILRTWFQREFRYTRDLSIRYWLDGRPGPTAMTRFLTDVRAGHCEYFATAATLLLRQAKVPARYATGYAVMERDTKRGEYVIRGTHGHAWCRVWDESTGTWIDFDPTPPDWFGTVSNSASLTQRFNDGLKRVREDFFIWRNQPGNKLIVTLTMLGIALAVIGFVVKRLWRTKRRVEARFIAGEYSGPAIRTPLHELEAPARKLLGHRRPGETFARWLARLRPALAEAPLLDEAIALHQQLRFDPQPASPALHERLERLTRQLDSAIKAAKFHPESRTF